jgi:putative restriction endonuclease
MRFWWVNHKQTYKQEIDGRYIWSPKANSGGSRNQTYDNMRLVVTADIVFSYANGQIRQVGIVSRPAASCPKPQEFGQAGSNWGEDGWMVPIDWHRNPQPLRPKEFLAELRPHLPAKNSPLSATTGNGHQNCYLAAVSDAMAGPVLARLGTWGDDLLGMARGAGDDDGAVRAVDDALEAQVQNDPGLDQTTRRAVVEARRGQGRFRQNVESIELKCRITGVTDPRLLRASHIKPWRSCMTSAERLDGNNGLLLCPNADHLFDRGYISFEDDGQLPHDSPHFPSAQPLRRFAPIPYQIGGFRG